MSHYYKIHFSLAEARKALPELRRRLLRINNLIAEIRADESSTGPVQTIILRGNGLGPIISGTHRRKQEAQQLIRDIATEGIQIKDLESGLVDFPHLTGEPAREVFLCWKLGEDTIEYWHEIEDGFAGRKPVDKN